MIKTEGVWGSQRVASLLDSKEVATILKIAVKSVNKRVREGKLACVQVTARERRFTHEQVQEYIRSQSTSVHVDKKEPQTRIIANPRKGVTGRNRLGFFLDRLSLRRCANVGNQKK